MRQARSSRRSARRTVSLATPSGALQLLADESPVHRRLALLQQQAETIYQRARDEDEHAAPEPVPVILSMDGAMIGSVYFETGRIRTTHVSGPEDERGDHDFIERYNIDQALAMQTFRSEVKLGQNDGHTEFSYWVSSRLWASDDYPWVINRIDSAEGMDEEAAPDGAVLFENFGDLVAGSDDEYKLVSHHPSRGAAVKEVMAPSDITALETAIAQVGGGSASQKNRDFFVSLLESTPHLAKRMRLPEEIDAQEAGWCLDDAEEAIRILDIIIVEDPAGNTAEQNADNPRCAKSARKAVIDAVANVREAAELARDKSYRAHIDGGAGLEVRATHAALSAAQSTERAEALLPQSQQKLTRAMAIFGQYAG